MSGAAPQQQAQTQERDRYMEANTDLASHIGDKIIAVLRTPENQSRMQSLFDPIVSHIINRVFPYILLSAILFLILFILTIGTFWIVVRSGGGLSVPVTATVAADITKQLLETV
jgi:hypothetical protein